ncbi:MAG TPA: hypothetical protein VFT29_17660 [Gemmatimonadaceae bacterium]|nr:hypothetical protein [Gemmatimonadaceae bacterium]
MRYPSRATRTLRSITGLLMVWCLGCSAYDPLIAALVPALDGRVMVCAADESAEMAGVVMAADGIERAIGATADRQGESDATCGCDSCHAPAVALNAVILRPAALPHQPSSEPGIPPSVDRTPLVPPPQRAT